jgi:hypothetical protein
MKAVKKDLGLAIDVNTISGFTIGGRRILIAEILDILKKEGILVYDSNKGVKPFKFDPTSPIKLIESNTQEAKDAIKKYYENKD